MKKLIALLLSLMTAATLAACGQKETADSDASSSVAEAAASGDTENADSDDTAEDKTDDVMERFGYNGTFDDEVFDKIVSSIVIGDIEVSYPCTLNDFVKNDDYEYRRGYERLYYKGATAATIFIDPPEGDDDIYDDPFSYLHIYQVDAFSAKFDGIDLDLSIGGIDFDAKPETIIKYLGEPTRHSEKQEFFYFFTYETDNYLLSFAFRNDDDTLNSISIIFVFEKDEEEKETSQ